MSGITNALNLAKSGLLTGQKALEVSGENIANVNTPGYTREVPLFTETPALMVKGIVVGTGANISQVYRQYDQFLARQLQDKNAALGEESGKSDPLAELERIVSISNSGLTGSIDDFFAAWQDLSGDPGSRVAREAVLDAGAGLANSLAGTSDDLAALTQNMNNALTARVSELNGMFEEVAKLNQSITNIEAVGPQAMADRDRRDLLLQQISYALGGSSIENANGMVAYYLPNGLPVVQEQEAFSLATVQTGSSLDLKLQLGSQQIALNADNLGGEFNGLLTVRDQSIPQVQDDLDKLAYTLADQINQAHQLGTGLDGVGSRDFFTPLTQIAGAASSLTVALTDYRQVAAGQSSAPGDNINALALSDLGSALLIDGNQTLTDFYAHIASSVGMEVNGNQLALTGNQDAIDQLSNLRDSKSGVSLEEEMVNLIRYQKSFEASAKFLTTVDDMMDTLLNIKR